ncbi:MAG TPA: class I SAM-dependent methyltransferase [Gaiellaceae bacterium]|nr:class I SAM-dependent methyltransferase [Gaiellaceae bacterium]
MTGWFAADAGVRYDESSGPYFEESTVAATVDFLEPLAAGGALELAVGTGRVAVPLAARGVRVAGIDYSPAMVEQLRTKSDAIPVTVGDMTATRVEGTFSLVYLVFNSITNLTTQEEQAACFANAAAHLEPGGCFVVEVVVPPDRPWSVFDLGDTHVGVDEFDPVSRRLVSHHFSLRHGHWERSAGEFRAVSPAELDLMARFAGLQLRERWAGWSREPFTAESGSHVSVWEKTAIETEVM